MVAPRVLHVEVLVVLLGRPEVGRGHDPGHERLLEAVRRALDRALRVFRELLLGRVVVEDLGAILGPAVAELAAVVGGVGVVPEHVEELRVGDQLRVERDLHRLGVPGRLRRNLLVSGVALRPAGVTRDHGLHAR